MQKVLLAIRVSGFSVLLFLLGPTAWVGCLAYLCLRDLRLVYGLSLGFAVLKFIPNLLRGGVDVSLMSGDALFMLLLLLLKLLLFAIFGIKIGYALRDCLKQHLGNESGLGK